tara:strand:+ start:169 stop:744 length:576 start_codon:yes stop_codon:yes gene_type:complete
MLESISLDIANYWTSNDFLTESNKNCGTLVAFDWRKNYLSEINTNIDLKELECDNFKFDVFVDFLRKNNFNQVLGLKNVGFKDNPSEKWTNRLKEILKFNDIDYDEYIVDNWPAPIPEFDVPDNIFILRYTYDEYSKIDKFAAFPFLFHEFITNSDWKKYYNDANTVEKKVRVIVFCNDIENLILHESFDK